ncbi:hypothetical protein B0H11DRAFT_2244231 [Mycena galericulata]|nr:hypothetical protein B0H11DRAFT_2244231 [Mycena galericulata]
MQDSAPPSRLPGYELAISLGIPAHTLEGLKQLPRLGRPEDYHYAYRLPYSGDYSDGEGIENAWAASGPPHPNPAPLRQLGAGRRHTIEEVFHQENLSLMRLKHRAIRRRLREDRGYSMLLRSQSVLRTIEIKIAAVAHRLALLPHHLKRARDDDDDETPVNARPSKMLKSA